MKFRFSVGVILCGVALAQFSPAGSAWFTHLDEKEVEEMNKMLDAIGAPSSGRHSPKKMTAKSYPNGVEFIRGYLFDSTESPNDNDTTRVIGPVVNGSDEHFTIEVESPVQWIFWQAKTLGGLKVSGFSIIPENKAVLEFTIHDRMGPECKFTPKKSEYVEFEGMATTFDAEISEEDKIIIESTLMEYANENSDKAELDDEISILKWAICVEKIPFPDTNNPSDLAYY